MTDDHAALIEMVRAEHHDNIDHNLSSWGPWCYRCQTGYPCPPVRLVEALDVQQAQLAIYEACANGKALCALATLIEMTGSGNQKNPWLGVTAAVALLKSDAAKVTRQRGEEGRGE